MHILCRNMLQKCSMVG